MNSTLDARDSVVWHGGNATDGQSYVRGGGLNPTDYTITLEKQVDLTGFTDAELRFAEMHDIAAGAGDVAKVSIVVGGVPTVLQSFSGSTSAYATIGEGTSNLKAYVNNNITIRFELVIKGQRTLGTPAAGGKGLFIDNVYVVGQ